MTEFNDINLPADFDDLSKHAPLLHKLRGKGEGFVVPENYFTDSLDLTLATCHLSLATSPFVVPENYFEELAERIISLVTISQATGKLTTDNRQLTTDNGFTVPEGYFGKLTNEIVSIAELASLKNTEAFEVPDGYFAELDSTLKTSLALDNLKQDEGFDVPDGYFGKLSDSILSRIAVEELNTGSDSDVPPGYFDTLANRISNRIAEEENAAKEKTVERGRVIVFAEVLKRYARPVSIAASLALVIGVSIWFFNHNNGGAEVKHELVVNPKTQQQLQPVISPAKKDSAIAPQQLAANSTDNNSKPVKRNPRRKINPSSTLVVKDADKQVDKNDVLDQADLLDVNTISDFVTAQGTEIQKSQDDEFLDESMKQYLLNDNADPGAYINNEQ